MIRRLAMITPCAALLVLAMIKTNPRSTGFSAGLLLLAAGALLYGGLAVWTARSLRAAMRHALILAPLALVAALGLHGIVGLELGTIAAWGAGPAAHGGLIAYFARQILEEGRHPHPRTPCLLRSFPDGTVEYRFCEHDHAADLPSELPANLPEPPARPRAWRRLNLN